jgi:peptide deformylase
MTLSYRFTSEFIENFVPRITLHSDPILRKKALPVELESLPENFPLFIEKMKQYMFEKRGAGIAAPQIGISARLFLLDMNLDSQDKDAPSDVHVFINPTLSNPSHATWIESEGCLSIPGIREAVERPCEIEITYYDLQGQCKTMRSSYWIARGLMHENDHLNGVLFIDRLPMSAKKRIAPLLEKINKQRR